MEQGTGAVEGQGHGASLRGWGSAELSGRAAACGCGAGWGGRIARRDSHGSYGGSTGSCLGGWAYSFSDFAALARDTSSSWETAGSDSYALALTAFVHLNDAHAPFLCTYEQVCVGDTCEGHSPDNPLALSGGLRVDRLEGGEATTVVLADTGFSAATAWGDEYDTTCSVGQQDAALDSAGVSVGDVLEAALTDAGSQLAADLSANLATLASSSCTD